MNFLTSPESWIALVTLTVLEIVLGVDNIVFVSILASKLPREQQARGRTIGLALAMGTRILLLLSITWVMGLTRSLFTVMDHDVTGRDLILLSGGLFLLWKSTREIHERLEGSEEAQHAPRAGCLLRHNRQLHSCQNSRYFTYEPLCSLTILIIDFTSAGIQLGRAPDVCHGAVTNCYTNLGSV